MHTTGVHPSVEFKLTLDNGLNWHESEQMPGDSEGQGKPGMLQSMRSQRVRHNLAIEQHQITQWYLIQCKSYRNSYKYNVNAVLIVASMWQI